jgi:hypothetical protein
MDLDPGANGMVDVIVQLVDESGLKHGKHGGLLKKDLGSFLKQAQTT